MECSTNEKFQSLTRGLASWCQGATPPPPARLHHALTRPRDPSKGPGCSGSGRVARGLDLPPRPPPPRAQPRAPLPCSASSERQGSPAATARPSVRPPVPRPWCGTPRRGAASLGAVAEGPRAAAEAGRRRRTAGRRRSRRPGGEGAELGRPPPPRERRAPRPGSHASHVRPLGAAAPRSRPRRVMRTDVKLPYEY